jgi:hypothetical protein
LGWVVVGGRNVVVSDYSATLWRVLQMTPSFASMALDHKAPSFATAVLVLPRQSLSGQKRPSTDGNDAAPSSRHNLPPSGRHRPEPQRSASLRRSMSASPTPAPAPRRSSRSPEGRKEHRPTRQAGAPGGRDHYWSSPLRLLNTAPEKPGAQNEPQR